MSKCCKGCGALLQDKDRTKEGYVEQMTQKYCRRCFRMQHYHEWQKINFEHEDSRVLERINQSKGFAFFFCDFLNLYPDNLKTYEHIKIPKVFCVTKCDSIPTSIYYERIRTWLRNVHHIKEDILFVSTKNIRPLKEQLEQISAHEIYLLGPTNAGKSSLLKVLTNNEEITISEMPNTTLNFIQVNYKDKILYDTVGFTDLYTIDDEKFLKKAILKKRIHPLILPLKEEADILIEKDFRLSFDHPLQVTFFASPTLKITRVYAKNNLLKDQTKVSIKIPDHTNVYLKGLCFFYVKESCTLSVYGLAASYINLSPTFFGGNYE